MSAPEPDLPRDIAEYRPRPLLGLGFWALMAFIVLCVLAGTLVALLGPKLAPGGPATPPAASLSQVHEPGPRNRS